MSIIAPYEIMPALYIDKSKRSEALLWIRQSPHPSGFRRGLARGWAAAVGVTLTAAEYDFAGAGAIKVTPVNVPPGGR